MLQIQHVQMIEKVLRFIKNDSRFVGLAVGGSYITNSMDEFSDLDFILVSKATYYEQVMEERMSIAEAFGELLSAFTGEHVGEPRLVICLYDSPMLHVDFKFVSIDDVAKRVEDPIILYQKDNCLTDVFAKEKAVYPAVKLQWIEDRFWVWVHYAAVKIGRGELFEVIGFLSFLRETVLSPLIFMKHGKLPRGVRKIEAEMPEYMEVLNKTVAVHDIDSCIDCVYVTISLYRLLRSELAHEGLVRRNQAEEKSVDYFEQIARIHTKTREF